MPHPILNLATQKEKTNNVWFANLFVTWSVFRLFVAKQKSLEVNPKSREDLEKYYRVHPTVGLSDNQTLTDRANFIYSLTNKDDQRIFLTQLDRTILIGKKLRDINSGLHINEISSLARTFQNDLKKFVPINVLAHSPQWKILASYINNISPTSLTILKAWLIGQTDNLQRMQAKLITFIGLMKNQARYKPLQKISWRQVGWKLLTKLEKAEERINEALAGLEVFTSQPKPNKDFLKISDTLKWVIIDADYDPFEQEVLSHCGETRNSGFKLLSLREFSNIWDKWDKDLNKITHKDIKKKEWLSRVTATVAEIQSNKSGKINYEIMDIYGNKNTMPDSKWHDAIVALYNHPKIMTEHPSPGSGFSIENLTKEESTTLFKKKPSLASLTWQIKNSPIANLKKIHLKNVEATIEKYKKEYEFLKTDFKIDQKNVILFSSKYFLDFLNKLKLISGRNIDKNLGEILEWLENMELHDLAYSSGGEYFSDLYKSLDEATQEKIRKKVELESGEQISELTWNNIKDLELGDAFLSAVRTGWEVGTESSAWLAYESTFDGMLFYTPRELPSIVTSKTKKGWIAIIGLPEFKNVLVEQIENETDTSELFVEDTERSLNGKASSPFGNISFEYDYEHEAAIDRLKEELGNYL